VAGVIASIAAAIGLLNLRLTRRNLEQQRELEAQRAQGTALQAYYEQIGKLITDADLLKTQGNTGTGTGPNLDGTSGG
jgi:type II secretory pathway pseudopilin PulG